MAEQLLYTDSATARRSEGPAGVAALVPVSCWDRARVHHAQRARPAARRGAALRAGPARSGSEDEAGFVSDASNVAARINADDGSPRYPGMPHGFYNFVPGITLGEKSHRDVVEGLRWLLAGSS